MNPLELAERIEDTHWRRNRAPQADYVVCGHCQDAWPCLPIQLARAVTDPLYRPDPVP